MFRGTHRGWRGLGAGTTLPCHLEPFDAIRSEDQIEVDTAGKRTDFAAESIDELEPLSTSLMPEQLLRDLTAGQAADLLSYLETLR
jgi:hypothetical protein